ncbi:MAG TPA: HAD family acid phosphatase [Acidobacteriota bacterium]|nr:HAD family acid phosphatase [Acidobacteriota bacterium]
MQSADLKRPQSHPSRLVWTSLLSLSLLATGLLSSAPLQEASPPDKLMANLWVEVSPEYRALCHQAFNAARHYVLEAASRSPHVDGWARGASGRPLAVVADLDETILDNSSFNSELALDPDDNSFDPEQWDAWQEQGGSNVTLVPGAGAFIEDVRKAGVRVVFLSNRDAEFRDSTAALLRRLGVAGDESGPWLLLKEDSSDKGPRRRQAMEAYEVIAYLGDNLGDFPQAVWSEDIQERSQRVEDYSQLWGTRWFVLPNPVYGSWTDPLRRHSARELLREAMQK